jgi:hypothetical protein
MEKQRKPTKIRLLANMHIRQANREKAHKRAQNALQANQVRQQQLANAHQLEMQRSEALLHTIPQGLQRDAILLNRGMLQKRYENFKFA